MNSTSSTFVGTAVFRVAGMTCAHCERAVDAELSQIPGVERVTVDVLGGRVTVAAARLVDRADIAAAVDEAGCILLT